MNKALQFFEGNHYIKIDNDIIQIKDLETFYHVGCLIYLNQLSFNLSDDEIIVCFGLTIPLRSTIDDENRFVNFFRSYSRYDIKINDFKVISNIKDDYELRIVLASEQTKEINFNEVEEKYILIRDYMLYLYEFISNSDEYEVIPTKYRKTLVNNFIMDYLKIQKPTEFEVKKYLIKNNFN